MAERCWRVLSIVALLVGIGAFLSIEHRGPAPGPDSISYQQLSENLASGRGYTVRIEGEPEGSRFPPGYPIVLAVLSPFADAWGATRLVGAALTLLVWWSAYRMQGPVAASVAVVLIALYLPRHKFTGMVMSDTTGALFAVSSLLALQHGRQRLAGFLAGWCSWVRLANIAMIVGLPRRAWATLGATVAGLLATRAAWGWGYRSGMVGWDLDHIWSYESVMVAVDDANGLPNIVAYPLVVLGLQGSITPPGAALLAGWAAWRRPERRFVFGATLALLAIVIPYFAREDRFLFPVAGFVAIYAGVGVVDLLHRIDRPEREPTPDSARVMT